MKTDSLILVLILWGMPTFIVVRGYLKMNTEDKKSAINDFRSRRFILTTGFINFGAFCAHLGFLFDISIVKIIGLLFFILGGIFIIVNIWNERKISSLFMIILIVIFFVGVWKN
ncbi:hypothetical protein [Lederbergia lenta]|uniref:Uncharacterized protein n=1 Tax=Lederbergia lenta TaxID=1467 RepID=A0A2X4YPK4_LEDLE|nr:hypothetical protein [Lederbergia lenta]MEC2325879.1 hypothetical protein [Lederbergia lenta]SQI53615.1 Uncharacterised protein [Lederbergia lenta]